MDYLLGNHNDDSFFQDERVPDIVFQTVSELLGPCPEPEILSPVDWLLSGFCFAERPCVEVLPEQAAVADGGSNSRASLGNSFFYKHDVNESSSSVAIQVQEQRVAQQFLLHLARPSSVPQPKLVGLSESDLIQVSQCDRSRHFLASRCLQDSGVCDSSVSVTMAPSSSRAAPAQSSGDGGRWHQAE